MVKEIILNILIGLSVSLPLYSQELQPEGGFLQDSVKIGEPVGYYLTFTYPRQQTVLFPGRAGNFGSFEYRDKQIFPTRSDSLYSYDSVVYQLTTFSIDKIQNLSLPVYLVNEGDSTTRFTQPDTIYLQEVVAVAADTVPLKENTGFHPVQRAVNYPYWIAGISLFIIILAGVYLFLGKVIKKQWQIYRLHRRKKRFLREFGKDMDALKTKPGIRESEKALYRWKDYMENLENTPYTKLTTREILNLTSSDQIHRDLRSIDRVIYGRGNIEALIHYFEDLQEVSLERYRQKVEEIKHA